MKIAVVALAVLAFASPMSAFKVPRTGNGALADDIQAFVDVIPINKMINIIMEYLSEDAEFQKVMTYIESQEFKQLIIDIEAYPEVRELMDYIQRAGLDAYYLVNTLNNFLGIPALKTPMMATTYNIRGGIRGFLDEIEALVPVDKIKQIYTTKMATSKVFADLMTKLRSPISQKIADKLFANPHFVHILDWAKEAGVEVEAVEEFLEKFLGLRLPHGY